MKLVYHLTSSQQTSIEHLFLAVPPNLGIKIDKESVSKTVCTVIVILYGMWISLTVDHTEAFLLSLPCPPLP